MSNGIKVTKRSGTVEPIDLDKMHVMVGLACKDLANVSASQIRLLEKYFNNVILVADNDEAGNIMKDKLIEKLGSLISVIKIDKKYKDIGDMDDETIRSLEFQFDKSISSMLN